MLRDPKIAFSFSLALTAIIVHYGVAETSIGGTIGKDRVLQLKDSPFAVVKNIRVLNNVTLTIEPGVILYFQNQSQLILDGTLIARGTPSQGILMSGGDKWWTWGGIVLTAQSAVQETTNATRFYRSSSVLEHVEIRNAGKSATSVVPAMQIARAAPRMHNVTIAFAFGTAIELVAVHGDVDFSDIVVRNASFYAIQGSCSRVFQCVDCVLEGNFAGGIAIDRIPLALDVPTPPSKATDFSYRTGSPTSSSYFVGDDGFWFSFNDSTKVLNRILYTSTGYGLSIDYARQRFSGGTAEIVDLVTGASPLAKLRWENSTDSLSSTFTTESNRLLLIYKPSGTAMTGDVLAFVARHPLDARTVSVVRTTINKDNGSWSAGDGLSLSGYVGSVTLTDLWVANHKNNGITLLGTGGYVRIADSVSAYFYSINYRSHPDWDDASRIGIDFEMRSFSVVVTGCRIVGYYHNGLYLVSKSQMSINVSGNVLTKGVDTTESPLLVQKTAPAFPNSTFSIGEQFTDGAVYVNNNTVEFSRTIGLDLEVTDQYGGTDHIEVVGNVISNGDVAFRFKQFTGSSSTTTLISDNTFVNHTTNWYTQWTASVYVSATTAASVTISRNFMTKNEGKYVLQVTSNVTFDPNKQSTMVVFVNNNTLIDNDVTDGWIGNTPNAVLQLGTTRYISCQYNVLANPKSRYELAVQTRASSSLDTIDVQYNYWGTTNQTRIQSRIYDFVDTNFVALASYFPYLLSPDPKNVSTESPLKIPFIYGGGQIGGHLDRELTVSAAGSPYDVVNDITVLSKGALIVEAGVTLHFPRDHGILVEGALVTNGTVNKPVVFTSAGKAYESSISARVANEITQFHIDGTWRTLCATDLDDYPAVYILAALACSWLGYPNSHWWSSYWNPKDGDPIIVHSSCPKNASSPDDCKLTLGRYSAIYSGSCARVAHLDCLTQDGGSTDNVWAGIRFNPNTGRVPAAKASTLTNTVLFGAGVWFQDRIPGVSRTLTSVPIDGVTLKNSVGSSSIESHSYEPSVLLSNFTIQQSLYSDGLYISKLPYQQVKVDNVSVTGAQGSGLRVQQDNASFQGQVTHFSICAGRNLSLTDPSAVYFVGISKIDYEARSRCRTTLQASEGDRIFVLLVSMTIYSADVIALSDSDGSLVEQISGGTMTAVRGPYISKGETMSITLTTGRFSHAPGFLMYVTVVQKPLLSPSIFINNSRFTAAQRSGIDVATDAVPFTVKNSRLDGCDNGIGVNCSGCHVSIAQNKIFNCTSNGFILSETGNISLVSNVIQGCQKVGQMTALFPGITTWNITQNKISSNGDGLAIEQSTAQLSVLNNTFESNSGNAIALSKRMQINAEISNNVFTDHGKGGGPLLVEGTAKRLIIASNTFKENHGDEYVVQLTPYPFTSSPFILKNNLFDGNVVIAPESCSASAETMPAVVVIAGSNQVNIQNNSFVNPNSTYQLGIRSLVQSSTGPSINASKNFWATTNEQKIRDGIYDFNYCTRVALAEIFPYLLTPFGKPVSLNASLPLLSIHRPNNVLLGRVLNDTTIPSSSTPYTVIGDLSVMPGKTLTVASGVQLKFKSNVGLFVEGNFLLKGTPNRPVFMTNIEVPRKIHDGDIRLFSKDAKVTNIGMAQIYHDSEWRAVCAADDSSLTPLNYFLAHTICLQLGYIRSNKQNLIAGANIAGWLPDVVCSYYDHSLEACDNYRFNKTRCIFGALSVTCDGIPVPPSLPSCHWSGIQFAANLQSKSTMENGIVQNSGKVNDEQMAAGMRVIEQKVTLTNVTVSGSVRDGMEVTNGRDPVLVNVAAFENNGSGIRFVNTLTSRQKNLVLTSNDGHGLEITVESELRPLWNIPVPESRIVDICSQRTVLTISPSEPVYIRYVQSAPFSYHCKMKMQTVVAKNVLSIQTLALKFQSESAYVQLDGTYLYREKQVQGSLHYVTSTKSVEVELRPDVLMYDYSPTGNYFFASVQSINPSSSRMHNISNGRLSSNNQTGLSIVASSSTADRSNVTISGTTISNNSYSGFQMTGSSSNTDVKAVSAVTVERCRIENNNNNRNSKSSTLGNLAGISIVHDNVDVVIQNCGIAKNARHAVHLTFGKSYTIFNNRIEDNSGNDGYDDTVFLGYSDGDDTSASVSSNTFVRNRMYGILRVDRRKAQVIGNVFTQNTANYLINTVQSTPNPSATEQRCLNNTLYKNSPTANGTCAVVAAAAADTANAQYYTNTFVNPDFQFEFCAAFNSRNGTISATHNWWGTANSSVAKGKVRDYSSDPTLAKVQIVPIKEISPMNTTVCSLLWSRHGKLCYSYVSAAADWKSAESYCQEIGGYLASSHFPSTDVFFRNLVPSPPPGLSNSGVWLGLYYSSSTGHWQWTDGTTFDHHILSNSYKSGNCAAMTVSNGKWIAEKCSNMKPFICASGRGAGPIKFSKLFYNASVSVGAPVGVNVTIVKAVSDGPGAIYYSIIGGNPNGYFHVQKLDGAILVAREIDEKTHPHYSLVVKAENSENSERHALALVNITVTCSPSGQCPGTAKSGSFMGAIIGGVVGGIVLLVVVILVALVAKRRSRSKANWINFGRTESDASVDGTGDSRLI
ncbi:protein bark beetle-like isoform X2 [Oscarella lobularis]|uniref:protein bark beetle-like isoform X2 n=1 Tax=Oscarella lobularis TaxID=121494 RepID=UPI00331439D7